MYPDGLCKLDDHTWSKCIEFEDVNYQLAKPDDQTAIFEALCDMYNAHDASIGMQLSLVSRRMNREDFVKRIEIAAQGDHFDHIRELYTQKIAEQQKRLRALEAQLAEEENLEIVRMVKAVKMDNKELTAFLKAYASGMISLPEGMLQEGNTENEETEGYEDEA